MCAPRPPLRLADGRLFVGAYAFTHWWEPWRSSDDAIRADFKRMGELGITVLFLDSQPIQAIDRDWDWLDRGHRIARETGLQILPWLESKGGVSIGQHAKRVEEFVSLPVELGLTQDGEPANCIIYHEGFRRVMVSYVRKYMHRYAKKGALLQVLWDGEARPVLSLNVEVGWEGVSFDDETNEMFRRWLRGEYGRIGRVNEAWGTSYASFADVDPRDAAVFDYGLERGTPDPPPVADHMRFRAKVIRDAMLRLRKDVLSNYPQLLLAAEVPYVFGDTHPHWMGYRRDNAVLPEIVDWADIIVFRSSGTLSAAEREWCARFEERGVPVILTHRIRTGQGPGRPEVTPDELRFRWAHEAAVFASGFGYYSWNEMVDCHIVANAPGVGAEHMFVLPEQSEELQKRVAIANSAYAAVYDRHQKEVWVQAPR